MATDNEISSGFVIVAGIENILLLYICYITRMLNKTTLFDIFLLLNIKPYVIPKDAEGTFLCKVGDWQLTFLISTNLQPPLDACLSSSAVLVSLSPHVSFVLSLLSFSLLFPVRHRGHSQKIHKFRSRQDIDHSLGISQFVHTCVVGSPLREDSPAGSPYALSASSPEQSLSSLSSPSSRHLIHRESPDLRDAEEDDHHTVSAP